MARRLLTGLLSLATKEVWPPLALSAQLAALSGLHHFVVWDMLATFLKGVEPQGQEEVSFWFFMLRGMMGGAVIGFVAGLVGVAFRAKCDFAIGPHSIPGSSRRGRAQ